MGCPKTIFYVILYLMSFLEGISNCGYFSKLSTSLLDFEVPLEVRSNLKYSATQDRIQGFLVPIKYQPTVLLQKHTIMDTPLSSACIKCGICLAVSEKLEQILKFALKSSISFQDFDEYLSSQLLRPICDFAFKSYGLKEWDGIRIITQYTFLNNVANSLEGRWGEVLRETCHFYLNNFGDGNLVKAWLLESQNVTSLLCRNEGLFRNCMNINQGVLTLQLPKKFLFPSNYVQITYPCA